VNRFSREFRQAYLPIACITVATVFVSILVLHARLNSSSSSIIIEIAPAIPIVMVAIPAAISTPIVAFHSQISIHRAIITVVVASARGAVTRIVTLLGPPIATDTNILAAFLVLLPRLFRLLRGPLGLDGSGLQAGMEPAHFRRFERMRERG